MATADVIDDLAMSGALDDRIVVGTSSAPTWTKLSASSDIEGVR